MAEYRRGSEHPLQRVRRLLAPRGPNEQDVLAREPVVRGYHPTAILDEAALEVSEALETLDFGDVRYPRFLLGLLGWLVTGAVGFRYTPFDHSRDRVAVRGAPIGGYDKAEVYHRLAASLTLMGGQVQAVIA